LELDDYVIIPELGKTVHVDGKSVNEIDRKLALACMSKTLVFYLLKYPQIKKPSSLYNGRALHFR